MTAKVHGGGAETRSTRRHETRCWGGQRELAAEAAVLAGVMQTNRGDQDVAWEKVDRPKS